MNTLDIILSIPLFLGLINGYRKGFFLQIAGIISLVILFAFGSLIAEYIQQFLLDHAIVADDWVQIIGYISAAVLVFFLIGLVARLFKSLFSTMGLGFFEKWGGAIFGVVKVLLIFVFIYYFFQPINEKFNIVPSSTIEQSVILDYIEIGTKKIQEII